MTKRSNFKMKSLTKHRKLILDNLMARKDHPTARSVYDSVKTDCEKISFATVYNSLEFLVREGHIKKLNINSESVRYDGETKAHSHLYCSDCNKVIDIPPISLPQDLDLGDYCFRPDEVTITINGKCSDCS